MPDRPSPIAAFLGELWRLLSSLSAGVVWGALGVVLLAWLGEIADYGSPRLEALLGPVYEPVMLLAYPVLFASVPALAFLGVWVATGFGARRGSWNRSTTLALAAIMVPCAIATALLAAAYIPAVLYPAVTLIALGAAYSAVSFVAAVLVLPGVLVSVVALWRRWLWAAPAWAGVWGAVLWLASSRVDFSWLPSLPVLLLSSAVATVAMLAGTPSNKRIEQNATR